MVLWALLQLDRGVLRLRLHGGDMALSFVMLHRG